MGSSRNDETTGVEAGAFLVGAIVARLHAQGEAVDLLPPLCSNQA
jgi:hypothetical protein